MEGLKENTEEEDTNDLLTLDIHFCCGGGRLDKGRLNR